MNKTGSIDFRSVLETIPFGVSILNHNLEIAWINKEALRYSLKTDSPRMKGRLCYREILGKEKPCDNCPVLLCFKTGKITPRELVIELNGQARCFSIKRALIKKYIEDDVHARFSLRPVVHIMEPEALPRYESKSIRVVKN